MPAEVIMPVHRPQVPADLLDRSFPLHHRSDAETLADLGLADIRQAAAHYRAKLRQARKQDACGRLLDAHGMTDPAELEEICRNVLTLRAHMHVKHDFGPRIDWTTVLDGDIESNVAINHHAHIVALALEYCRHGHQRYAVHAVQMLRSWFEQSPAPTAEAKLQWRTLEVGGRLSHAWPIIGLCLCDYEGFGDRDLFDLVRWTWLSVRHLRRFVGPPNNWLQIESIGALCGLALLGDVPAARGWPDLFGRRLDWINRWQFLPDGMQAEDSPGYHVFPWWRLYSAGVWIELFGGTLPPGYWAEQVQRARPLWMLRQPDGTLPALSDCGPQPVRADRMLNFVREHQTAASLPDPVRMAAEGRLPEEHRVCHLPYAGYTACRTSWKEDAEYLLFDHGFYGTNHQHEDKLTFLYAAGGRMLIGDAGIYRYSRDDWEHYFRGAPGHNLLMVDGRQQCRSLRAWQGRFETIPDADCRYRAHPGGGVVLSGWYRDGFAFRLHHLWDRAADRSDEAASLVESIQYQRVLAWLPGRGLLVIDRLTGQGEHQVDQVFHLEPFRQGPDDAPTFRPGTLWIDGPAACLLPQGQQPGVLLIGSSLDSPPVDTAGVAHGQSSPRWVDRCGQQDPPQGWTSRYGLQPSHDLWRCRKARLPMVLGAWIQPWCEHEPPGRVGLQMRMADDKIGFVAQVHLSDVAKGTVDIADLSLDIG